jgi:hypothetical protein
MSEGQQRLFSSQSYRIFVAYCSRPDASSSQLDFLVLISVRDRISPRALLRLEGLGKLKKKNQLLHQESKLEPSSL